MTIFHKTPFPIVIDVFRNNEIREPVEKHCVYVHTELQLDDYYLEKRTHFFHDKR